MTAHLLGRAVLRNISISWVLLRRLVRILLSIGLLNHAATLLCACRTLLPLRNVKLDGPRKVLQRSLTGSAYATCTSLLLCYDEQLQHLNSTGVLQ